MAASGKKPPAELELLKGLTGAFRPGVLTVLMGVSGAGKTTFMDVLAGRKTSGRSTGDVRVNGHPQNHAAFSRVSGYCEQFDLHSSMALVHEALWFSARLRVGPKVDDVTLRAYVKQVTGLVELGMSANALVGVAGLYGLSTDQRKRLTIAVELVANPAIVFMDEPTTGLDARAAAVVMRVVRNVADTGRTIVCTIHQPSIDIFESFDELLLLKRGGELIYSGPLGRESRDMVAYFGAIPGVAPIAHDYNPATWMLDISIISAEARLGKDLAELYRESELYRQTDGLVDRLSQPAPGSAPLAFATAYPQPLATQYALILRKNLASYLRNTAANAGRFVNGVVFALLLGSIYWLQGHKKTSAKSVLAIARSMFSAAISLGFLQAINIMPVLFSERAVFYRERAAGFYSAIPYAIAQGSVEFPFLLAQSVMFAVITYFMMGLENDFGKLMWYVLFVFLFVTVMTCFGVFFVAISPNFPSCLGKLALVSQFHSIAAGFSIPVVDLPRWLSWTWRINVYAWAINGLTATQLGDDTTPITSLQSGEPTTVAEFVEDYFGFHYSDRYYVAAILVGFIVVLRCGAIFAIVRLNFLQR